MNKIIKNAVIDLNSLDDKQVVKVAGVLQRIRNWMKSLTDPEYRERVAQLKNDSAQISSYLKNLDKYLEQINLAIENGDVDKYNQALEEIKHNAGFLSKELDGLVDVADQATIPKPPVLTEPATESTIIPKEDQNGTSIPQDIKKPGDILGDVVITENAQQSINTRKRFVGIIRASGFSAEEAENALNNPVFWKEFRDSISAGKVIKTEYRDKDKNPTLNGDWVYLVFCAPFTIPDLSLGLQIEAFVVDQTYNLIKPNAIKKFVRPGKLISPIKMGPKARARIKEAQTAPWYLSLDGIRKRQQQYDQSQYVPTKITPIAKEEFINGIKATWPKVITDITLSEEGVNILYAQAALETGNFSDTKNYNFGNIKASPKSGKWTSFPCGENLDGKSYKFTARHPMCYFRAFETAQEGIAFYLGTLGKRYHSALEAAVQGDVKAFANELHENGYYTAKPELYLKGLNRYLGIEEPTNELAELEKALGINLTAMVVDLISEKVLPRNDIHIKIKAADISSGVEYAYILSNAISRTIEADTDICKDNNSIIVNCNTTGGIEEIKDAVQAIDNIVSKAFLNKYRQPIISIIREGKSNYSKISESQIDRNRRKFKLL
jgi:hypothetical protein